jgi:hypothetical protein
LCVTFERHLRPDFSVRVLCDDVVLVTYGALRPIPENG